MMWSAIRPQAELPRLLAWSVGGLRWLRCAAALLQDSDRRRGPVEKTNRCRTLVQGPPCRKGSLDRADPHHAQLLEVEHWFKQAYPNRDAVRVSALPEADADEKATPVGSFAFRLDEVTKLAGALRGVLAELVGASSGPDALREQCEAALVKAKLKPALIRKEFMKPFGGAKPQSK